MDEQEGKPAGEVVQKLVRNTAQRSLQFIRQLSVMVLLHIIVIAIVKAAIYGATQG